MDLRLLLLVFCYVHAAACSTTDPSTRRRPPPEKLKHLRSHRASHFLKHLSPSAYSSLSSINPTSQGPSTPDPNYSTNWAGVSSVAYYFPPSFPAQIDALVKQLYEPESSEAEDTHFVISIGYAAQMGGNMCMNQVYQMGPPTTGGEDQQPPRVGVRSLTQAAGDQASAAREQQRCAYFNTTIKADAAPDIYTAALSLIQSAEGPNLLAHPAALSSLPPQEINRARWKQPWAHTLRRPLRFHPAAHILVKQER
ncbi:hypothetical protein BJX70DRAFT_402358 [Aspergillus crustosus]